MKHWYRAVMFRGHEGARKQAEVVAYVFAESPVEVRDKLIIMPAVKGRYKSIRRLSEDQSKRLERDIDHEARISLEEARRTWYYPEIT